jgi:16S rRNA (guanine527-N7)-methyltransferase
MDAVRIAELLDPFMGPRTAQRLTPNALAHISIYIDILLRWNARISLTAIRDPEEIVLRHFGESLFAAIQLLNPQSPVSSASSVVDSPSSLSSQSSVVRSLSVADLGSGAGFPGIPLKLWAPQISLTLIESNYKKATFLREVVRSLALTNVNIKNARAESLTETFDLVTLRAVEDFASILPTAAARVAPGGRLGLLIGSAQIEPARALLPHFSWSEAVPIPHSRSRVVFAGS